MKQFAVIGLGRFGASVALTLAEKGQQVIAIDKDEDLVHDVMDIVTKAVCLDCTEERAAKSVGLDKVDVAVCAIGSDLESSILVTLLLKDLGVPVIVCKATNMEHKKVLEKVGATRVILPEKDTGVRVAETLISTSGMVLDQIGLSGNSSIIEILTPQKFAGKTLREIGIRARYGLNVIAIKKKTTTTKNGEEHTEEQTNVTPQADDILTKEDVLVVFGENSRIEELKKRKS